jgi:hypothetical protein
MIKVFQKILLLVAVITVSAHSIFPHMHLDDIMTFAEDHHHEQPADTHHHDDTDNSKDNQHNLFSLAQLDENFVPANGQAKNFKLPVEYIAAFIVTYLSDKFPVHTKTHFGWYKEYPPPHDYRFNLPSRAPPAIV